MSESLCSDEDSGSPPLKSFTSSDITSNFDHQHFQSMLKQNLVSLKKHFSFRRKQKFIYFKQIENQLVELQEQRATKSNQNSNSDREFEENFYKRTRVGNRYQATIPKYLSDLSEDTNEDKLLWDPSTIDSKSVEDYLRQTSSLTRRLMPVGNYLRDDEKALYILQQQEHDVEKALQVLTTNHATNKIRLWSKNECRKFEQGLLTYGKDFFLIQKNFVTTRRVGELVQFYYRWKKTERYDILIERKNSEEEKYALNPDIPDCLLQYISEPSQDFETVGSDACIQFVEEWTKKDVQENS